MDNQGMTTLRLRANPEKLDQPPAQAALDQAAEILRGGGTVAMPTETVYGLAANALDPAAVVKIFAAKNRPSWDPLIVHVCDQAMLQTVAAGLPQTARLLMERYWPGPLTLLLPRTAHIPDAVTAGRTLVGVRTPAHPVALALIRRAGLPLAAPSANRFGHTSPTSAQHVLSDLDGRIDAVLDAGPSACGVESTVLDPNTSPMIVYRPGAVTLEQIRAIAGPVELFAELSPLQDKPKESLPSPGVGLRHYAPAARLILVEAAKGKDHPDLALRLYREANQLPQERLGVMLPDGLPGERSATEIGARFEAVAKLYPWGQWSNLEELAQRLFAGLRELDALGCTVILCPVPPGEGIAVAIRDRLRKAATPA